MMKHDGRMQRWLSETAGHAIRFEPLAYAGPAGSPAPRSISACSQAVLRHYDIDPARPEGYAAASARAGIEIKDVSTADAHLTMTLELPMPWNSGQMIIATHPQATVILPGMAFSPMIADAAIGRPLARLVGHPALDSCQQLVVTKIEHVTRGGRDAAVLHFRDRAEALDPHG
jgi:hypothetical protein